jgi:hypothetical protein
MNLNLHLLQADFSLSLPEDIIHFNWDWDTTKVTQNLDMYMTQLNDNGNPNPTLRDLNELKFQESKLKEFDNLQAKDLRKLEAKSKKPQKVIITVLATFIIGIVALALIALLILWQCGRDFLFKIPFFQRFMYPGIRQLLQLWINRNHPSPVTPTSPAPITALEIYQPFVAHRVPHFHRPSTRVTPPSPPPSYQRPRGLPVTPGFNHYPDLNHIETNPYALVTNPLA